ncbi:DEAD/DEAH box helicase family protein [Micromonospora sp. WMMD1082]|uniref:DEAD/DEAH box helicase n=1 Tax=Micromonospora sp. WMMD1082 TaxID=3016104 RepID=UPI0024159980|nr:DEAD/DEAH box helicase family protein [Micromonospora sp. WMMD1082]MDG4793696.1 DEAD/DEAH box helicase family protein [Micromonospora sp. WMMD1082]
MTWIEADEALVDDIASRMDLRIPNRNALKTIVEHIAPGDGREVVADLATGVGKTYITAALIDYLGEQGVSNVLIVTPGRTIQEKTIANFTPGHAKFVPGMETNPLLVTAENFARGQVGDALRDGSALKVFVFNVQQLIRPTANTSRRVREVDEFIGADLYSHLQEADDLVVIADEHHVYRSQARAFSAAVRDLHPRALVGLTATPDAADEQKVIFRYSLAKAIADELVKVPVIAYREDGHNSVRTQLADACHLRRLKAQVMTDWHTERGNQLVNPVLFVVCQTIEEADDAAAILAEDGFIGDPNAVLVITSQSSDDALKALERVENPDSPIQCVVSVNKLREGWDVKNISVIVALRKLASEALTEQILGRGLRLPYGRRVGVPMLDSVDLIAHESYRRLLANKNVLLEKVLVAPQDTAGRTGSNAATPEAEPAATQGLLPLTNAPQVINGEETDGSLAMILASMDALDAEAQTERERLHQVLKPVAGAPTIRFPRREREIRPSRFTLSDVTSQDARREGARFMTEIAIPLRRDALDATHTIDGDVQVVRRAEVSEVATQNFMPVDKVRDNLVNRLMNLPLIEWNLSEFNAAKRVVDKFLEGAGVTSGDQVDWGEARAQAATFAFESLIRSRFASRVMDAVFRFRIVNVPPPLQPMPVDVADHMMISSSQPFLRGRFYSGWVKSILPLASFDAERTELRLARILDAASQIRWWLRISTQDQAYLEMDDGTRYFPDFIAIDSDGVHWVVEGKSDRDADRADVVRRKASAESWARAANDSDAVETTWRYLFVTESVLRQSANNWATILTLAPPED